MEDYQVRVVDEKKELDEKAKKLLAFISSGAFSGLESAERGLLDLQLAAMLKYSRVLRSRIERFPAPETKTSKPGDR